MNTIFRSLALTALLALTASLAMATATGHVPTNSLGFHDGTVTGPDYSVNPTQRQSRSSSSAARSELYHNENVDIFFNFEFDTTGHTVYIRYTTNGTIPSKSNGSSGTTGFERFGVPGANDRWWYGRFNGVASGTVVRYVIYSSTTGNTLANANRRMSPLGFQTTWTEGEAGAYYEFTVHHNTTGSGGDWTTGGTWASGSAPNACGNIATILSGATVTLDAEQTVGNLNVFTGGTFNNGANKLNICTGGTLTRNGTFNGDTGTIAFLGSGTVSAATTFYNLEVGGGGLNPNGSTIGNSLTIKSGGSLGSSPLYGANSTLIYDTSGSYTPSSEWSGGGVEYPTAGGPFHVQVNTGTSVNFSLFTTPRTAAGNVTINTGSALNLSANSGGDLNLAGNFVCDGNLGHNGRAVRFNSTGGSQSASGNLNFAYLFLRNTTSTTFNNDVAVANEFDMIAGTTLNLASGVKMTLTDAVFDYDGGTLNFAGGNTLELVNNSDLDCAANLDLTGVTVVLSGTGTVDIFGAGTRTFNNISTGLGVNFNLLSTINGIFTLNPTGFVSVNAPFYGVGSTLIYNPTSTFTESVEWTQNQTSGQGVPYHVQINAAKTVTLSNPGATFTARGNLTIDGTLNNSANSIIQIGGNLANNGTFDANSGMVTMNGSAAQTITGDFSGASAFHDLTIANTHASDKVDASGATAITVTSDVTVNDGIFVSASDYHHVNIAADGTLELSGPITVSGDWNNFGAFTHNNNTVTLDGNMATANIAGDGTTFYNLAINKDNNTDAVNEISATPIDVANNLTITRGVLTAGDIDVTNNLSISGNGTLTQDGEFRVGGNFSNTGTYNAGGQNIVFNGGSSQNLTANAVTAFSTLTVGAGTTLIETVPANNASASTLVNNGVIRKDRSIAAPGNFQFGLTDVGLNYTALGSPATARVDRIAGPPADATAQIGTSPEHFDLSHTLAPSSFAADVTLPHAGADPYAARYVGPGVIWDTARDSFTASTVTRNGVTAFSIWAVSEGVNATEVDLNGAGGGGDHSAAFEANGPAVNITTNDAMITDLDSVNLTTGTITLTNPLDGADDLLTFDTTGTSIAGNYNTGTGILTLTGPDTLLNFQTVLRTIAYNNNNATPNLTSRVIEVLVHDGALTSAARTTTITLTPPTSVGVWSLHE